MKVGKFAFFLLILLIISAITLLFVSNYKIETNLNMIEVNDIIETIKKDWDKINQEELPGLQYGLDYVVLDFNKNVKVATRPGLNEDLKSAITNRDTIIDIVDNDVVLGKLIIYNNSHNNLMIFKNNLVAFFVLYILLIGLLCLFYVLYINKFILQPFQKLNFFAKQVASGNLDIPLSMDKGNYFGAFTESFDLMRDELKRARENERNANQSKKELVASLSHDIKTPIASIKAVSEIMQVKLVDENIINKLKIIDSKADQINTLITNIFNATLEELQELKVEVLEESSKIIYDIIKKADYLNQVTFLKTAECIVLIDPLRLSQVIDNIISNSYKYANTSINVSLLIEDKYLEIHFKDFGLGPSDEELALIFNKYYRGKNASGKAGTGLGLYISKYLMNKMKGDINCEKTEDGFLIKLKLLIA